MTDSIWATLSAIDCSEHIEKKGKFSYLAWTWAWAKVCEVYPRSHYSLNEDIVYPDGTMEVRVTVTVMKDFDVPSTTKPMAPLTHTMWLPVLDYQNKPIPNPNAFDINTARMRCLVKCLAMFGLGHYIYAGESTPAPSVADQEDYAALVALVANNDCWGLRKFSEDNRDKMDQLFNMAPQGGKTKFKDDVRKVYSESNDQLKSNISTIEEILGGESNFSLEEVKMDCGELEWQYTMNGLSEVERHKVQEELA